MLKKGYGVISIFLLTILISILIAIPAYGERKVNSQPGDNPGPAPEPPKYIKHVVIIAIDDLESKYFNPAITPRLVGVSKEGIQAKVLDKVIQPEGEVQDLALLGKLPAQYRATQRKSLLVDGRGASQELAQRFNFVLNSGTEERNNPKQIIGAAINKFREDKPFLTYITLSSPGRDDREKNTFFRQADEAVGQFMGMLHERGLYDYTLFLIMGRRSPETTKLLTSDGVEVPLSFPLGIKGPNLIAGQEIPAVIQEDLPTTVYYLTDGKEVEDKGSILWNILKTDNSYAAQSFLRHRINDISAERDEILRQQWNWERAKLKFEQQRTDLQRERQGIKALLDSRDQTIKVLRWRITIYHGLGMLITFLFIAGLFVQYFVLRKRFLLF
ncbi:MAG: hypothetical protein M0021_06565 [Clostridia bacterium]|nr:hypothetical protein [Clostridia bacterium]